MGRTQQESKPECGLGEGLGTWARVIARAKLGTHKGTSGSGKEHDRPEFCLDIEMRMIQISLFKCLHRWKNALIVRCYGKAVLRSSL